ncbi:hypothetical protein PCE1_004332 [Barthelona sp. PCE]
MRVLRDLIMGVDLGTSNSAVSVFEDGKARIIENSEGSRTTPSVVAFKGDQVLVGSVAQRQASQNAKDTFFATKRLIGRRFEDPLVSVYDSQTPFSVVKSEHGDAHLKRTNNDVVSPVEVGAHVLQHLKERVEAVMNEKVTQAIITCPSYFDESQRQATKNAGEIAGLEVLRTLNEPTAAALAYGIKSKDVDQIIAVFDLGGGTFDVTLLRLTPNNVYEVVATHGNTFLGGEDFTKIITDIVLERCDKSLADAIRASPSSIARLAEACEAAKISLSQSSSAVVSVPFISFVDGEPRHVECTVSRSEFEARSSVLVDTFKKCCKQTMSDAGLSVQEVDEVLLVGGQTRMPLVREAVEAFFRQKPSLAVNPDEVVAEGAAIQAGILSGEVSDVLLLDVAPLTLGIEIQGGRMGTIIARNSKVPCTSSQSFTTVEDNQTQVTVRVLQGESVFSGQNSLLGEFQLCDIPAMPKGMAQIEVTFSIDASGFVHVSAKDKFSGASKSIKVKSSGGMSRSEIDALTQKLESREDTISRLLGDLSIIEKMNLDTKQQENVEKMRSALNSNAIPNLSEIEKELVNLTASLVL